MLFFVNQPKPKTDFIAPDGTVIDVHYSVAECDPPEYTYYMKIGDAPSHRVEWKDIFQIMHGKYQIPIDQIPDKYVPKELRKSVVSSVKTTTFKPNKSYANNYLAADGTVIQIGFHTAESCPGQNYFYYSINGISQSIEQRDIFDMLTKKYGIQEELVDHYKIALE